jgi:cytochrome c
VVASNDTWVMFDDLDFTGIGGVKIGAFSQKGQTSGGNVELRLDSPDGQLMGQVTIPEMSLAPQTITFSDKINDRRKLYLVFKNPDAEGKPLFGLTFLEFFR